MRLVAILAGLVAIASLIVLATGDWYLVCMDDGGSRVSGIDCLGELPTSARSDVEPYRSLGWAPAAAAITGLVAGSLLACAALAWRDRRNRLTRS